MYKKCEDILNKLQYEGKIKISDYQFPPKQELKLKLKDLLESEVDEKYYLSEKLINCLRNNEIKQREKGNNFKFQVLDEDAIVSKTVTTRAGSRTCDNFIKCIGTLDIKGNDQIKRVYSKEGVSPTLTDMQGGNRQPKILEPSKKTFVERKHDNFISKKGYIPEMFNAYNEKEIKDIAPTQLVGCGDTTSSAAVLICAGRGRNPENPSDRTLGSPTRQRLEVNTKGVSNTITTVQKDNYCILNHDPNFRIRKLTPKECWRLMGFKDSDFEKAEKVNSNTQLYKQAGNSIVVNVLESILKNLIKQ